MTTDDSYQQQPISLRQLTLTSLYIGVTGYGGPAIMGHIKPFFVTRHKWVNEHDFLTGLSLSQMLPGALASISSRSWATSSAGRGVPSSRLCASSSPP